MAADRTKGDRQVRPLWRILGWGGAACLLLLPLVAMQFTDEVDWDLADFIFMGALMASIGIGLETAVKGSRSLAYRVGAGLALLLAFLTIWLNGAVGIIGSENEPANLLFGAVVATALLGALIARLRPIGMGWAMAAAALVQLCVPVVAWFHWPEARPAVLAREVFVLTGFFTGLWLLAACLFRNAAEQT